MEAVFVFRRMSDTVLVHAREHSAEFSRVWDAHCHINEGAEIEVTVRV